MLNIPKNLKKPEQSDYKVSVYELETFQKAKQQLGHEKYERKEKNEHSSCLLAFIATWIVAFLLLSMLSSKDFNAIGTIFLTTVIAAVIAPFIGGFFWSAAEKTVDAVTSEPQMKWTPNQSATKAYDEALAKYNKTIESLKSRYPDIEKVNYDADKYLSFATSELSRLLNQTFVSEIYSWWDGQMLNFKSCIMIMLKKMGYEDIKRTDNVRDPIDASRSYTYDLVASKNGEKIFVRCFHTVNGELTVGHINVLWQEAHKNGNAKAIFATNYKSKDIPNEINDFATSYNVEIWDMSKLLEITNEYFLKNLKEPPVTLPSGFEHKLSYNISRTIGTGLLSIRPYHYYLLSNELFDSIKDALTKIQTYPEANLYYGVCEYPRKWQYRGGAAIYGVIACYSEDGSVWRLAKECAYMFDAKKRDFIRNQYKDSLGDRSKFMPYFY